MLGDDRGVELVGDALVEEVAQAGADRPPTAGGGSRAATSSSLSRARSTRCEPRTRTCSWPRICRASSRYGAVDTVAISTLPRLGLTLGRRHRRRTRDDDERLAPDGVPLDADRPRPDDERVRQVTQQVEDVLVGAVVDRPARAVVPRRRAVDRGHHVHPQPRLVGGGVQLRQVIAGAEQDSHPSSPGLCRVSVAGAWSVAIHRHTRYGGRARGVRATADRHLDCRDDLAVRPGSAAQRVRRRPRPPGRAGVRRWRDDRWSRARADGHGQPVPRLDVPREHRGLARGGRPQGPHPGGAGRRHRRRRRGVQQRRHDPRGRRRSAGRPAAGREGARRRVRGLDRDVPPGGRRRLPRRRRPHAEPHRSRRRGRDARQRRVVRRRGDPLLLRAGRRPYAGERADRLRPAALPGRSLRPAHRARAVARRRAGA